MKPETVDTYTALAEIYDVLMADVDYEMWSDFIDEIIQTHHPHPIDVLEMACGTGSLSLALEELDCYNLTATDRSPAMIEKARYKAAQKEAHIEFKTLDFIDFEVQKSYDIIFSVFDSVNYLHEEEDIIKMLSSSWNALNDKGLLIFDFSTPRNSLEAVDYLNNEEGSSGNFRYFRESRYDAHANYHYNEFEIEEVADDGKTVIRRFQELHQQRVYSLQEMLSIVEQSPYHLIAKYEDFDLIDADENSTRVTMVLCRKPQ